MERKVSMNQGAGSSRDETFDEEDELDYPGLNDEGSGSGPVSREAYIALKQGELIYALAFGSFNCKRPGTGERTQSLNNLASTTTI